MPRRYTNIIHASLFVFDPKRRRKIVENGSLWEKIRYIALCIFTVGYYSVGHQHKKYCRLLEKACIRPDSRERITVQKTCAVFRDLFPNNRKLQRAEEQLNAAIDKRDRSSAKQKIKEAIDEILTGGFYGDNASIERLRTLNFHPRLAEAKFALSQEGNYQKLHNDQVSTVYKIYDRCREKCLAIFKVCAKDSDDAVNECRAWDRLREPNGLPVKKTLYTDLSVGEQKTSGVFQKFIKGQTVLQAVEQQNAQRMDETLVQCVKSSLKNC